MVSFVDRTGQIFGKLTVVSFNEVRNKRSHWWCICTCGNKVSVDGGNLQKGHTKSCGCSSHFGNLSHGGRNSPEYNTWTGLVQRCTNANSPAFYRYGGRGIDLDPRWLEYENFIEDMGQKPTDAHSLERKDNDVGYWPFNCVWATRSEQGRNTRSNRSISFRGVTLCLTEWCERLNLKYTTIYARLRKSWSVERAFSTPTKPHAPYTKRLKPRITA